MNNHFTQRQFGDACAASKVATGNVADVQSRIAELEAELAQRERDFVAVAKDAEIDRGRRYTSAIIETHKGAIADACAAARIEGAKAMQEVAAMAVEAISYSTDSKLSSYQAIHPRARPR